MGRGGPGAGPRRQVVAAGSSSKVAPVVFGDEDDDEDEELLMDPRKLLSSRLKRQSSAQHQQPEPATAQPKRRKLIRKVDRAKVDTAETPAELPEQDEGPFWASDSENQPKVKVTAEPKSRKLVKKKSRAKDVDSAEVSAQPSDQGVTPPFSQDNFEDQADFVTGLDEVNGDGEGGAGGRVKEFERAAKEEEEILCDHPKEKNIETPPKKSKKNNQKKRCSQWTSALFVKLGCMSTTTQAGKRASNWQ
ncbi:hypothetical protein HDU90_000642 [Geranomyces variabilis]|nr:hypothetical protein HDU90_000642 [Geranomyces variabilis]